MMESNSSVTVMSFPPDLAAAYEVCVREYFPSEESITFVDGGAFAETATCWTHGTWFDQAEIFNRCDGVVAGGRSFSLSSGAQLSLGEKSTMDRLPRGVPNARCFWTFVEIEWLCSRPF